MKKDKLIGTILIFFMIVGCAGKSGKDETELILTGTGESVVEENFAVEGYFGENDIIISELYSDVTLNSIPIEYDANEVFLSMVDEKNGYLLYCSSGAGGQMMKLLYFTNDRWNTYSKIDISYKMDGYPTSLSAESLEHLYIGTQVRSNGYLFESTDGGQQWTSVVIDDSLERCRYGYAPLFNEGTAYVLLECDGTYSLYQSRDNRITWEKTSTFSLDNMVEKYFITEDILYIIDSTGNQYSCFNIKER